MTKRLEELLTIKHYILQVKRINPFKAEKVFYPFEGFGIECGDGWYDLLDKLCTEIEKHLDKNPESKDDFSISQIKDKFGGLRFYHNGGDEETERLIDNAEKKSYKICESCGLPAKQYSPYGWVVTLCKECKNKYVKRMKGEE